MSVLAWIFGVLIPACALLFVARPIVLLIVYVVREPFEYFADCVEECLDAIGDMQDEIVLRGERFIDWLREG